MTSGSNSNGLANNLGRENRHGRNVAYWLPLGVGTGVALGAAFDNLALGIAIGAAFGAVVGMAVNLSRKGAADLDTGTHGGRWIAVIAVGVLVFLAFGAIFLYFPMR